MANCPCGLEQSYENCCGTYHAGAAAPTAEALMRSRYTAYARGEIDYILATHDPEHTGDLDRAETERWSKESTWLGLTILAKERGGEGDSDGVVEFVARHRAKGRELAHHERSTFRRIDGRWYFIDGQEVKPQPIVHGERPGRNDPCSCGSGKKFKKCHGA